MKKLFRIIKSFFGHLSKPVKYLWYGLAGVIILMAIMSLILHGLALYVNHYRHDMEKWAEKVVHHPVTIGHISASWSGFEPTIKFQEVSLYTTGQATPDFHLQEMDVGIDMMTSLLDRKVVPGNLKVDGANVEVMQDSQGKISIAGVGTSKNSQGFSKLKASDVFKWLYSQDKISLSNINILFKQPGRKAFGIKDFNAVMKSWGEHHRIVGAGMGTGDDPGNLHFVVEGRYSVERSKHTSLHVYIKGTNLDLQSFFRKPIKIFDGNQEAVIPSRAGIRGTTVNFTSGRANVQLWADYNHGSWHNFQGTLGLNQVKIKAHDQTLALEKLNGDLSWQPITNGWELTGDKLFITTDNKTWPEAKFTLKKNSKGVDFSLNQIDLSVVSPLVSLMIPEAIASKQAHASGQLNNIHFSNMQAPWQLEAHYHEINWEHSRRIPGVSHLSGQFVLTPQKGMLLVDSENLVLQMPDYYSQVIPLGQVQGKILWQHCGEGWCLHSDNLLTEYQGLATDTQLQITVPKKPKPPTVNLSIQLNTADINRIQNYMPDKLMDADLVEWLHNAIKANDGANATLAFHGALMGLEAKDNRLVIHANLKNMNFSFEPDWPSLKNSNAEIDVVNGHLSGTILSGQFMDNKVEKIHVDVPYLGDVKPVFVNVDGSVKGTLQSGFAYMQQTPIWTGIQSGMKGMQATGPMQLHLTLKLPIAHTKDDVKYDAKIALTDANLYLQDWKLDYKNIEGVVEYNNQGLFAKKMTATFLNEPVSFSIATKEKTPEDIFTQVLMQGKINTTELSSYLGPLSKIAKGKTDYQSTLKLYHVPKQGQLNEVTVRSDLKGIQVNLPAPLGKQSSAVHASTLTAYFKPGYPLHWRATYGQTAAVAIQHNSQVQGFPWQGEITFGGKWPHFQDESGFIVNGYLGKVNVKDWMAFLNEQQGTNNLTQLQSVLRSANLRVSDLNIYGRHLTPLTFHINAQKTQWAVSLNSPKIGGDVVYPYDFPKSPVQANLDHLQLLQSMSKQVKAMDPRKIPPFIANVQTLKVANRTISKVHLDISHEANGVSINEASMEGQNASAVVSGNWSSIHGFQQTHLQGQLSTENYGRLLDEMKLTNNVVGNKGGMKFTLNWPGTPYDPILNKLTGDINLNLGSGRVIDIGADNEKSMDVGRLLSIFSPETFSRRIKGDFSDLTKKGYSYNDMRGDFTLQEGLITTTNANFNGPVAAVGLVGSVDAVNKTYHLMMKISPHYTSSLPVVVTVAGTLVAGPLGILAGAATWAADKVVSPELAKVTSYNYKITGPWNKPEVALVSGPGLPLPGPNKTSGQTPLDMG